MSEMPEVETLVRDLQHAVVGRTIERVSVLQPALIDLRGVVPEVERLAIQGIGDPPEFRFKIIGRPVLFGRP